MYVLIIIHLTTIIQMVSYFNKKIRKKSSDRVDVPDDVKAADGTVHVIVNKKDVKELNKLKLVQEVRVVSS